MDGTPVDNNRLVLVPFLNTLTVRASPSLSASQYPKDMKSCITRKKLCRLAKNVHNIKNDPNKNRVGRIS